MQFVNAINNTHRLAVATLLAIGMVSAATLPASAARVDVRTLTCQQAVNLVQSRGAVVLTLTNMTYDRIVRDFLQCKPHEQADNVFAQTRDNPRCLIGKRCMPYDPFFGDKE